MSVLVRWCRCGVMAAALAAVLGNTTARAQDEKPEAKPRPKVEGRVDQERPKSDAEYRRVMRQRLANRIEELEKKIEQAKKDGKEEELHRLQRQADEVRQMIRRVESARPEARRPEGPGPKPSPEEMQNRLRRLRAAADNLREAGFPREAEHVMRLIQMLEHGDMPRPEGPRPDGPPREGGDSGQIERLRNEMMQMRREMQEMREHMKRQADRESK